MRNFIVALSVILAISWVFADLAKLNVVVLDDDTLLPIQDCQVVGGFRVDAGWAAWTDPKMPNIDRQKTDRDGRCRVSGTTNCGRAGVAVRNPPDGYYRPCSGEGRVFERKNLLGVWQPDDLTVTVRLQRVKHPIPLIAKRVGDSVKPSRVGFVDGTNTLFRYDFVKGDYLPPDGVGEVADMVVESKLVSLESTNVYRRIKTFFDFANTITFPGAGNGLVPHISRPTDGIKLRMASNGDYKPSTVIRCGRKRQDIPPNVYVKEFSETNPDRCYSFRIRSKFDEDGNLIEAYYGKVYGDFKIGSRLDGGCSVEFTYYLNPTSLDRNLECNCKTNLCTNPGRYLNLIP